MTNLRRLAVIGDVHTEHLRLAAALRSIAAMGVDLIACTGDIVDGPGSASACCALLREHSVTCVRGNHDRWLFTGLLRDRPNATQVQDLSPTDQAYLRDLPATREFHVGSGSLLLCHGVGASDLERITSLHTEYTIQSNRAVQAVLAAGHQVMVNGHSHEHLVVTIGALTMVNAGSLKDPDAGFLVLDFPSNHLQWHAFADGEPCLVAERPIFTDA